MSDTTVGSAFTAVVGAGTAFAMVGYFATLLAAMVLGSALLVLLAILVPIAFWRALTMHPRGLLYPGIVIVALGAVMGVCFAAGPETIDEVLGGALPATDDQGWYPWWLELTLLVEFFILMPFGVVTPALVGMWKGKLEAGGLTWFLFCVIMCAPFFGGWHLSVPLAELPWGGNPAPTAMSQGLGVLPLRR